MFRHNEHLIKFLPLPDSLHALQVTLADIRPGKSIKKQTKNVVNKLAKPLLPLNPLIVDGITFIIRETVRISKCSKLNSFL